MFPCIRCTKASVDERDDERGHKSSMPKTKKATKSLTTKLKDIVLRISCTHKQCKGKARSSSRRRKKGHSDHSGAAAVQDVGGTTPAAALASNVEQNESQDQWLAEVEEGIHITFASLPTGGNALKRIHFSREKFNRDLAQRWWTENYDRIKELYNVQRLNLNTLGNSADEVPLASMSTLVSFTDELTLSSNAARFGREAEWVHHDEQGVFITIRQLADGTRELRRIRFRKQFDAEDAKKWWLDNKERVEAQYL